VCTACHANFGLVNGACVRKTTTWHNGKRLLAVVDNCHTYA
jgi:hypothetical protein